MKAILKDITKETDLNTIERIGFWLVETENQSKALSLMSRLSAIKKELEQKEKELMKEIIKASKRKKRMVYAFISSKEYSYLKCLDPESLSTVQQINQIKVFSQDIDKYIEYGHEFSEKEKQYINSEKESYEFPRFQYHEFFFPIGETLKEIPEEEKWSALKIFIILRFPQLDISWDIE